MTHRNRYRAGVLTLALVAASAAGVATSTSAQAVPPPWQASGSTDHDPNQVGTLSFYDATGNQVYGGSTEDPFDYVVGSTAPANGDTLASLYQYQPRSGVAAGAWSGTQLGAASTFATPPAGAPTGKPTVHGTGGDTTIAAAAAAYPNTTTTDGYAGVYELRLRTTHPGSPPLSSYDVADIRVTGSTWSLVYPVVTTPTSTSLTVTPAGGAKAGSSATLTATVTPSEATGTVQFSDGTTALGSAVTVSGGTASTTAVLPKAGARTLTATFTPTGTSHYEASAGTLSYTVAKATPTLTVAWPSANPVYGRTFTVKATVTATGVVPSGTASVKFGSTTLASKALASGKATVTVPGTKVAPGKRTFTLAYGGSADVAAASSTKALTVVKATSTTANSVSPAKVSKSRAAKLTVKVTATGVVPTGTITVYDGSKKLTASTLKATAKGKVVVTLPKLAVGKHSLHAVYAGSSTVGGSKARTVTLTVTR